MTTNHSLGGTATGFGKNRKRLRGLLAAALVGGAMVALPQLVMAQTTVTVTDGSATVAPADDPVSVIVDQQVDIAPAAGVGVDATNVVTGDFTLNANDHSITSANTTAIMLRNGLLDNSPRDFTLNDLNDVTGADYGIFLHTDSEASDISITSNGGTIEGTASDGIYVFAHNAGLSAPAIPDNNITIDVGNVIGGNDGIEVAAVGNGEIDIDTSDGTVTGGTGFGITVNKQTANTTGDITITTADVSTDSISAAIYANNQGTGGITVDTTAGIINENSGDGTNNSYYGIWAETGNDSLGDIDIETADIKGMEDGVHAVQGGVGNLFIDTTAGSVEGDTDTNAGQGIEASITNGAATGNLEITTADVSSGSEAIISDNNGTGDTIIDTTAGTVRSGSLNANAIQATNTNSTGGDLNITVGSVYGSNTAIEAVQGGSGAVNIDSTGGTLYGDTDNGGFGLAINTMISNTTSTENITITTANAYANGGAGITTTGINSVIAAANQGTGGISIDTTAGEVKSIAYTDPDSGNYDENGLGTASGISALIGNSDATGNIEITTGDVTGAADGIHTVNAGAGDTIIDTTDGTVTGGLDAIVASHSGAGDGNINITTADIISTGVGAAANGIVATNSNAASSGDIIIHSEGEVLTDGWYGINATNAGTGNIDITTDDTVIGWGDTGINVLQTGSDATGGRITITTHADVSGDNNQAGPSPVNDSDPSTNHDGIGAGIHASNYNTAVVAGEDAITITADADTLIEGNTGVFAETNSGDITVDVGSVTGEAYGIHTENEDAADAQQGASNVIVRGDVDGGEAGIYQWTYGDANTLIESGASVSNSDGLSSSDAILYDGWDGYTNHLTIQDGGTLTGNVSSGLDGQDIIDNFGTWNNAGGISDLELGADSQLNNYVGASYLAGNTTGATTTTLNGADYINDLGGDFVMQNRDERITGDPASNDPEDPDYVNFDAYVGDIISMPDSTFVTGGGNLLVDTDIALGDSDELHVQNITLGEVLTDPGDPSSGVIAPTLVNVNVVDGLGQPTAPYNGGDGILIADVSGTSDADALQLQNELRGGLYTYSLDQGQSDTQSWFLQAAFNEEALAAGSASVMGSRSALASLSNLHDRQRDVETLADYSESRKGVWGRVFGQGNDFETTVSDGSGTTAVSGFDSDLWGVQAGLDFLAKGDEAGNRKYAGLYVAYADNSGHYTNNGARIGKMEMNTTSLGLYYTKYTDSNWYLDLVGQYSHLGSAKIKSAENDIKTGGNSYALSLEVGKQFNPKGSIISEVQAQLIDQYTEMDDITLNDGTQLAVSSVNAVTGRLGVRLYGNPRDEGKSFLPWVRANLWHTFSTSSKVSSLGNTLSTPIGGTSGELELGFSKGNAESGGWGFYGSAGYLFDLGGAEYSGWKGTLGLRKGW